MVIMDMSWWSRVQEMYQNLGCSVDVLGPAEREERGITMAAARDMRRAVLKAPVKFPNVKRRGPVKR
jgi:DNA-directed RNA polymerase I subunit RPA49